jgi:hypothetical protein
MTNQATISTSEDELYEDYDSAYRTGHEGYDRYPNKSFDEVETELQRDYEAIAAKTDEEKMTWEQVRQSVRDAWDQAATT